MPRLSDFREELTAITLHLTPGYQYDLRICALMHKFEETYQVFDPRGDKVWQEQNPAAYDLYMEMRAARKAGVMKEVVICEA